MSQTLFPWQQDGVAHGSQQAVLVLLTGALGSWLEGDMQVEQEAKAVETFHLPPTLGGH